MSFRLDAATSEDALAVMAAMRSAGLTVTSNHTYRRKKRGDPGIFWDGQVVVPETSPDRQDQPGGSGHDQA